MTDTTQGGRSRKPAYFHWIRDLVQIAIMGLIIWGGVVTAKKIIASVKRPERKKRPKMTAVVQVKELQPANQRVRIEAMGTVIPAREVDLQIQVSGQVTKVHPNLIQGATLPAGAVAVEIDRRDYEIALHRARVQLLKAEADLALERGQHDVAKQEWEMLQKQTGTKEPNALALRIPQLKKAEAAVESVKNDIAQAELNLSRTKATIPFNALVRTEQIDVGSQISAQTKIADLVGTDEFWVKVTVPVERLTRILVPGLNGTTGSPATINYGSNGEGQCQGTVIRLLNELEPGGRMAQILVSVKNPLEIKTKKLPLLLNSYVRVLIEGTELDNVFEIPRSALRDNGKVWILDPAWKLIVRDVQIAWRAKDSVLVSSGIESGEKLILSDIPAPVPGMPAVTAKEMRRRNKENAAKRKADVNSGGKPSAPPSEGQGNPKQ